MAISDMLLPMQGSAKKVAPAVRDLVLLGGGHSHVSVLKSFGMRREPGVRVTLISRELDTPYSGMLPGCVAGFYNPEDIHIKLGPLCRFANARLIKADVCGLDLEAKQVLLANRPPIKFDVLSINTGAVPIAPHEDAVTVKPIGEFLPKWREIVDNIQVGDSLAIVGAGAGGVELAMAARSALPDGIKITVYGPTLMSGHNAKTVRLVHKALQQRGVGWVGERVEAQTHDELQLASGRCADASHVLWVTHVQAPEWLDGSGLATDHQGFITVNKQLQSTSHGDVFAAGDVASLQGQPRPKSGVYAVRAGAVLATNLRHHINGKSLRTYRAQQNYLALLGDGTGKAIASRGSWATDGRLWWLLKDKIDRNFINKFNNLPDMFEKPFELPGALQNDLPTDVMRCGGCGAKLAADPLRRVLARLPVQQSSAVILGMGDDAALIQNASAQTLLTIDGFRAMLDDPYLFGRIAAHHSLNDIFAMAATPTAALAFITLPLMSEALMEEELFQVLSGVVSVLNDQQVSLVGGHTAEGAELTVALTITGAPGTTTLTKGSAVVGDRLILTKALGTGVILAAAMQGQGRPESFAAALQSMDQSNGPAVRTLMDSGAHTLTDITGFGLVGHLSEILRASMVGAELNLTSLPLLIGAETLLPEVQSSLQQANELALADFNFDPGLDIKNSRVKALADPQTSGGLLACVPASEAAACLAQLSAQGYCAADIGCIADSGTWVIR